MGDLLDEDFSLVEKNALYRCLDQVLKHRKFLRKIEDHTAKPRAWLMERGIPTEEVLTEMRSSVPPIYCLVGDPKGAPNHIGSRSIGRSLAECASRRGSQSLAPRK